MVQGVGKIFVVAGLLMVGLGVLLMWSDKIPFLGRLPGDISFKKDNVHVYVPFTTSIVLSIVISIVLWLISWFNRK